MSLWRNRRGKVHYLLRKSSKDKKLHSQEQQSASLGWPRIRAHTDVTWRSRHLAYKKEGIHCEFAEARLG